MRINKITAVALMALVLIVLNILFFAWTDEETRGTVEWMSYGFTMFSFVVACISIFRIRQDSDEVYHLTTNFLPISYFCVQTILSVIAIYYGMVLRKTSEMTETVTSTVNDSVNKLIDQSKGALPDSIQGVDIDSIGSTIGNAVNSTTEAITQQSSFLADHYAIIVLTVYLLVLVFYAVNLGIHSTANKATAESLAKQAKDHLFIQENSQRLQRMLSQVSDPTAKKAVNSLYESIRFSANQTTPEGKQIEAEVAAGIGQLASLISTANWDAVKELAQQLNEKIKMR